MSIGLETEFYQDDTCMKCKCGCLHCVDRKEEMGKGASGGRQAAFAEYTLRFCSGCGYCHSLEGLTSRMCIVTAEISHIL